jgi:hypothetical protein
MKLARAAILTKEKVTLKLDYRNLVCRTLSGKTRISNNIEILDRTKKQGSDLKIIRLSY